MLRYPLPHSFKVVEYKEQGKSIREIAKEMGLSRGKVERTLKQGVS